ncbi:MAG: hypothetical protein D6770_02595, partial [Anaerolineae bacterium]
MTGDAFHPTRSTLLPYLLLILAILGFFITPHYGESWDELKFYKYADHALSAYLSWPRSAEVPTVGGTYDNYGPAYVMLVTLAARPLGGLLGWSLSDTRHLLYWFTFLAGLWAFHDIARRFLRPLAALGATLLFLTQPLFWGHAFISPKDIPFLSFFLLSLAFGLRLTDAPGLWEDAASRPSPRSRRILTITLGAWLLAVFVLFGGTGWIHAWLERLIRAAAAGEASLLSSLIARAASDLATAGAEVYIQRAFVLFLRLRAVFFWGTAIALTWLVRRHHPGLLRLAWRVLPAALLLGLTTCIRILGPLAGILVAAAWSHRHGKKAMPTLLLYAGIAMATVYVTWPYLWADPIARFVESAFVMARYPWEGRVLFNGVTYASNEIPRAYLPTLLAIQLTEPVWVLAVAGLAVTGYGLARRDGRSLGLAGLVLVWFVLPVVGLVAARSPLYDNFRQVFFILPPVFLLAGVALEAAFRRLRGPILQVALLALVLLPGVWAGVRLHPYEYIYYNRFIGGVDGAFRRFELDYWGISYREAARYVNRVAP